MSDYGKTAFPLGDGSDLGMSLRDYFAAKAINLFSLNDQELELIRSGVRPGHYLVAKFCYELADAMLAERSKDMNTGAGK